MPKIISIKDNVNEILEEMREELADDEGTPAPYNTVIRKLLKETHRWKSKKQRKEEE